MSAPKAPHRLHLAGYTFPPVLNENGTQHTDAFNDEPLYAVHGRRICTEKGIRHSLSQSIDTIPLSRYEELK